MPLSINRSTWSLLLLTTFALSLPQANAQYITDAQKRENEQKAKVEVEHNYYKELVGKRFWYQPGKYVTAAFYSSYSRMQDGAIYLDLQTKFTPEKTVSFVIEEYIPSKIKNFGSAQHVYRLRIEDGTPAFMSVEDFGGYAFGITQTRDFHLTDHEHAVLPSLKAYNNKLLTKSPEDILASYEEKEKSKAEAAEAKRREEMATKEKDRQEFDRSLAAIKAEAAANKRKGGVRLGMTQTQALNSSWGKPRDVNRTTNASGVSEQWVYGNSSYLYFTNGKLTSIQN